MRKKLKLLPQEQPAPKATSLLSRLFVGIDPGIGGAVAIISDDQVDGFVDVFDMPTQAKRSGKNQVDPLELIKRLSPYPRNMYIVVEQVSAMPGQGVSSMFSLGDSYGCARSVAAMVGRCTTIHPAVWKKAAKVTKEKAWSLTLARKAFPSADDFLTRKKDEGRAEALLLAQYALRNFADLF